MKLRMEHYQKDRIRWASTGTTTPRGRKAEEATASLEALGGRRKSVIFSGEVKISK